MTEASSHPPVTSASATSFKLTRGFATVAGLIMVAAVLLLSAFHWYWSLGEMEAMAQQNNVNVARVLANLLWSRHAALLQDLSAADPATLPKRPEMAMLRDEVAALTHNAPVYRVKIYDRDWHTIFSTDPAQIGEDESDDEGFQTVGAVAADEAGVRFEVADTGIGMAAEDIPVALSAFGQIDSALNRRYSGAGLGLTLAKGLTELLGGSFEISSESGRGTRVGVNLPASSQENRQAGA